MMHPANRAPDLAPTATISIAPWHCVHIHYEGPKEPLLIECIGPLIDAARTRGLARWFFLRYWKGGSHVRVRLQFSPGAPADAWEAFVDGVHAYLREKPSQMAIDVA